MKQPSWGRVPKKHVILFLAANPLDTDRVALDREARAIQLELRRSGYRDRFEFVTWWAAEPLDLLRMLRERRPTIVHFSGHGARPSGTAARWPSRDVVVGATPDRGAAGGVAFMGADGRGQVVTPAAFAQALAAAGAQVRLVVLNACFTAPMAQALAAHVDCVVGMTGSIQDDAARIFSIGFYGGLGEQASVAAAFAHGTAAINLEGLTDIDQPQLVVREGFDADRLVLAATEPAAGFVEVPCPYPGMRPFTADDTDRFRGREGEITELIGRFRAGEREIFVIGPSGSGKSSLVTAGVLPRLARGVSGLGPCVVRVLRPGEQPAVRLAEALEVPEGGALVVPPQECRGDHTLAPLFGPSPTFSQPQGDDLQRGLTESFTSATGALPDYMDIHYASEHGNNCLIFSIADAAGLLITNEGAARIRAALGGGDAYLSTDSIPGVAAALGVNRPFVVINTAAHDRNDQFSIEKIGHGDSPIYLVNAANIHFGWATVKQGFSIVQASMEHDVAIRFQRSDS